GSQRAERQRRSLRQFQPSSAKFHLLLSQPTRLSAGPLHDASDAWGARADWDQNTAERTTKETKYHDRVCGPFPEGLLLPLGDFFCDLLLGVQRRSRPLVTKVHPIR